jgi:transposase
LQEWLKQQQAKDEIEVVSRPIRAKGFILLHRRWVVERTLAWLNRYRRLSKEYDYNTESSEAQIQISSIQLMLRRLKPNKAIQGPSFKYPKKVTKAT